MTYQERLSRNVHRTLLVGFFQVFLVILPVAVPFFQSKGLSMQEVFSLQALFGLVVLLTEVPSGYLADLLGRKNTLIVGAILAGIGQSFLLVADGFWTLAIFEFFLALSHSLISGADLALLYDTELALGRDEEDQRQVVGRLYGARTFSEALAGVACTAVLLFATFEELVYLQVVIGWLPASGLVMFVAQLAHAATFGFFHGAAVALTYRFFRGRHQAKGQALYSGIGFGAGGAAGGLMAGFLWDRVGGATTFSIGAAAAAVAFGITARWLRIPETART